MEVFNVDTSRKSSIGGNDNSVGGNRPGALRLPMRSQRRLDRGGCVGSTPSPAWAAACQRRQRFFENRVTLEIECERVRRSAASASAVAGGARTPKTTKPIQIN